MDAIEFIQNTASEVLVKQHLKLVFDTYYQLFGEVCTGCPVKVAGYIRRIKNYTKEETMTEETHTTNFVLKDRSIIVKPGSNEAYSNANLTDEVAIAFLKKNPNRKVLFSKLPKDIETLLKDTTTVQEDKEITLEDYTMTELRTMFPEAKGRSKKDLITSIETMKESYVVA
ncbi:hypothetical protein NBRC110019_20950 [Neptunitalea chrysea]|uniref:Uncharacterized protein n=1 Tax=Neptunitalea chrysea TaxID=1647581 RepID=A0A9W6B7L0_9FLAO|nr:hypothetical protein [Neptunitalea chrysea]GLB53055.1 hypothetical protein NBRC110019_20950 [Neptunitalea chrysea]